MDDKHNRNDKYEQEFIEKVRKSTPSTPPRTSAKTPSSKSIAPIVVAIIFAIIAIVETIVLAVFIANGSFSTDYEEEVETEAVDDSIEAINNGGNLTLDENYMIIAFDYTCDAEDGSKYVFKKSKNYQKIDASSNVISSGTYSIINGGAIILNDSNKDKEDAVVYFDGYYVMEGLTFYSCGEE